MRVIEETAKTVDEAVELALEKLDVDADQTTIEVLEEPSRGFMGFLGSRPAKVRVTVKESALDKAQAFLAQVADVLSVNLDIEGSAGDDGLDINISGPNVGMLIGRRGQALDAWQYLTNLVVNKDAAELKRVTLDVAGYRERRMQTLANLAHKTAERAKERQRPVTLEPMSAAERRIIHLTLQDDPDIETLSEGREPYRRVVVVSKER